jgi:hypothetical protein
MQAQSIGRRLLGIVPHPGEYSDHTDLTSTSATTSQRLAAGGMALLLLAVCGGAWVLLIGFQRCALSSLLWR